MKQKPPHMKQIILANTNVKLYSWTFTFRKVEQQQMRGGGGFNSRFPHRSCCEFNS